jgi:glycosyltransferase involved in cell wall biosynthesis
MVGDGVLRIPIQPSLRTGIQCVMVGRQRLPWRVAGDWLEIEMAKVRNSRRRSYAVFVESTTFCPAEIGESADLRRLGFCLDFSRSQASADLPKAPARAGHWLDSYDIFVANSNFTASWIKRRWSQDAVVLPPPIDTSVFSPPAAGDPRRHVILSVGRFFAEGHNKKHDVMIRVFRTMMDRGLLPSSWRLVLAGSRHTEKPSHLAYYEGLLSLAGGYPVQFAPDIPFAELLNLYRTSSIYWHAAGFGESEGSHPERFEHFGITTCEAMACGLVPVVIDSAGQRGIVAEGQTGYTFKSEEEMIAKTLHAVRDVETGHAEALRRAATASMRAYSPAVFHERVRRTFIG